MKRKQMLFCIMLGVFLAVFAFGLSAADVSAQSGLIASCNGPDCQACNIVDLIQNVINYAIGLSIPIAMALFAYAGVLYFSSEANAHGIETAKKILRSALVGFIVALGAYLIVDTVLHSILDSSQYPDGSWFKVECVSPAALKHTTTGNLGDLLSSVLGNKQPTLTLSSAPLAPVPVSSPSLCASGLTYDSTINQYYCAAPQYNVYGGHNATCADDNPACSVSVLQGDGLNSPQAASMSCIAVTESSGNPSVGCSSSGTPCGLYQINNGNWNMYAPAGCTDYSMKNDATCNRETAVAMVNAVGYQPWTGHDANGVAWNPNATSCVNQYDPNTSLNR